MIAGVDISTKGIAVVTIASTGALFSAYWFGIEDTRLVAERCRDWSIGDAARSCAMSDNVYVEQPMGRNIKSVAAVERIVGAFLAQVTHDIPVNIIGVTAWKALAGMSGHANKAAITAHVVAAYPQLAGKRQDIHDAAGIALAGHADYHRATTPRKAA